MEIQKKQFESVSFWELLQRHSVEIPIIQRDYAQGRAGKEKLRSRFVAELKNAITGMPLELDFIYGDVKNGVFLPLDGQQRLTTLFLLHWYAAKKENIAPAAYRDALAKFSYETRASSREFCKSLIGEDFDISWDCGKISPCIRDCPWFFASWEKDPTVSGMLTMLDDIQREFVGAEPFWETLTGGPPHAVSFNFIRLVDFGLSDDLYIKMNARGRPLTNFENFKAVFEKRIDQKKWDEHRDKVDSFAIKIDAKWTDPFWNKEQPESFDSAFLNFIRHAIICSIACEKEESKVKELQIKKLLGSAEEIVPDLFDLNSYEALREALDAYSPAALDIQDLKIPFWGLLDEAKSLLANVTLDDGPIYQKRVLLFAHTLFLQISDVNASGFSDWMRVVRNIVQNSRIDGEDTFIGAVMLIKELSSGASDIYSHLQNVSQKSKFASSQMIEEKRKAQIIHVQPEIKNLLHQIEDSEFCQGRISFALYCVNTDEESWEIDSEKLSRVKEVFNAYFDNGISDLIRRALFTIGDGNYFKYWESWLYAVGCPKHRLIVNMKDFREFASRGNYRHYLKDLVEALLQKPLQEVIDEFEPNEGARNWQRRLIKEPELLEKACQKFIAVSEENDICYLIPGSRVENSPEGIKRLTEVK